MIKKLALLILVVVLLFSLSACSQVRQGENPEEDYRVGSQGLRLSFLDNMPPSKIYDDEDFNVGIEIENLGATDVNGALNRVYLSGFDPSIISNIPATGLPLLDLAGKDSYNPDGDFDILEFNGFIRDLADKNIDKMDITMLATACYSYQTIATPTVCIDPDPYSMSATERVCDYNSVSMSSSQGAPVAVTNVDVDASRGKTRFKIYIQNVGSGTVIKSEASNIEKCNPNHPDGLDYDEINQVLITDVMIGDKSIKSSCKPLDNNYLRLKDSGSSYMICELSDISGPAYTTPLRIILDYGYRTSISKSVEILQTP